MNIIVSGVQTNPVDNTDAKKSIPTGWRPEINRVKKAELSKIAFFAYFQPQLSLGAINQ